MRRLAALAVTLVLALAGCGSPAVSPSDRVSVEISKGSGSVAYEVEVAASPAQRQRGLMGRRALGSDAGMLFLFPAKVYTGFWMKGTLIPLDIAFIADDRIIAVRSMTPCKRDPCPATQSPSPYDAALEVNAGSFATSGVVAGARVTISGSLPSIS